MKNKAAVYRVVFIASVIIDALLLLVAFICILCGTGSLFGWLILIFIDIIGGVQTNSILYRRMKKYEQVFSSSAT